MALSVSIADAVAVVEFDNPPANSLSGPVIAELSDTVDRLAADADVRAVVFTSAGHRAYLSGADISEFPEMLADPEAVTRRTAIVAELFDRIARLPQPTIAAVRAPALGGGLEFVLLCDLVVSGPRARFALPEVGLGVIPGGGGTQRLPRRVGQGRALEMVLLGTSLTAAEAQQIGLVSRVVADDDDVNETAMSLAREIAQRPRVAVQSAKRAIVAGAGLPLPEALALESREFLAASASADSREGPRAFLDRRRPQFTHM
jgi:enoyl-CoA hydratase/carnithine racemase